MSEVIIYLLKVTIIHAVFFLMYWLFFRMSSYHAVNRAILLSAIGLSFVIPLLKLPHFEGSVPVVVQENPVVAWFADPAQQELILEPIKVHPGYSPAALLPWVYLAIASVLLIRSVVYLVAIHKLKRKSEAVPRSWFTLFKTSYTRSFSFFRNVFIPRTLFGSEAFESVLAHECVHVRRFHSWDRLFLDFVVSLFWFNPFIYCYRNAPVEIHEYEADEGVIKQYGDHVKYQEVLFSQLNSPEYSGLVSHFNFQMIKKRIVMMNKQKKRTGWIYGLMVPVTLLMIFAFSSKEAMRPLNQMGEEITSIIGPMRPSTVHPDANLQDSNEPSVLPLRIEDMVRMSSGFGMRMHPIEKEKKMHLGMDFVCPIGTEIVAAAAGEVIELRDQKDGYGKLMIVDHGNGFVTRYGQLSQFEAKEGDRVARGEVIALSGNSGMSTGPHLHYEVMKDGENVDPADYIKNYSFGSKKHKMPTQEQKSEAQSLEHLQDLSKREQQLALRTQELNAKAMELAMVEKELVKEEIERVYVESLERADQQREKAEAAMEEQVRVKAIQELAKREALETVMQQEDLHRDDIVVEVKKKSPKQKRKNKQKKKDKNKR